MQPERTQSSSFEDPDPLSGVILRNMAEGVCLVRGGDQLIVYANPRFALLNYEEPDEIPTAPPSSECGSPLR